MFSCTLALLAGGSLACQRGAVADGGSSTSDDASSGEDGPASEGTPPPPEPGWAYGVWSWSEVRNQGEQHRAHNITLHEPRRYDYADETCDLSGGMNYGSAIGLGWEAVTDDILELSNSWPTSPWFGDAEVFYMRQLPDCRAGLYATFQAAEAFAEPTLLLRRGALCVDSTQGCSPMSVHACGEMTPCGD